MGCRTPGCHQTEFHLGPCDSHEPTGRRTCRPPATGAELPDYNPSGRVRERGDELLDTRRIELDLRSATSAARLAATRMLKRSALVLVDDTLRSMDKPSLVKLFQTCLRDARKASLRDAGDE